MADDPPKPYEFRIKPAQRPALLRQIALAVAPLYFISWEQMEGDELVVTIIPASTDRRIREELTELQTRVDVTSYPSGTAEPEVEL